MINAVQVSRIAEPHNLNPDPAFHFSADPDPDPDQSDGNMPQG